MWLEFRRVLFRSILYNEGCTFLLISTKIEDANTDKRNEINAVYDYAKENDYNFYCLTATGLGSKELKEYLVESGEVEYEFANTDEITLKTIIRSNPGLVLIKDGIIINKWSYKNIPVFDKPLDESVHGVVQAPDDKRAIINSILAFIIPLVLLLIGDHLIGLAKKLFKKKK